jgi:hypothetical protein
MRLLLLFFVLCFFGSLVSCKKYAAADPAIFISPSTIAVSTTTAQGSGSHKITDLWVYVNGKFIGAYPTTNTFPAVTKNQAVSIDVFAGVLDNGIKASRTFLPFYEPLHFDTTVEAGKTITRPFTFKYRAATNFTWTENFEGQGISMVKSPVSNNNFTIKSGSDGFEGRYLYIAGDGNNPIVQIQSSGSGFGLPASNANVYLELNYKCNDFVTIGLINADGLQKEAFTLNASSTWNKIYISLASTVNTDYTSTHKVFFKMLKKDGYPDPELFLDNVKLVFL